MLFFISFLIAGTLQWVSSHYTFATARKKQQCLPYKYMIVEKNVIPQEYGEYITFRSIEIPNFADGVRFIKMIAGLPGDRVEVRMIPENKRDSHRFSFEKNGELVTLRLQGSVYLYRSGKNTPIIFDVIEKDSLGNDLPIIKPQVIPKGKYFVIGTKDRTFDSRYWGLVDEKQVIGQAYSVPFM